MENDYQEFLDTFHPDSPKVNILPNHSTMIKTGKVLLIQYSGQISRPDSDLTHCCTVSSF